MKKDEKSLEEKAKEFFKLEIYPNLKGIHPTKIENFEEKFPLINYLSENRYICEIGDTVKTFLYISTLEGRRWAFG